MPAARTRATTAATNRTKTFMASTVSSAGGPARRPATSRSVTACVSGEAGKDLLQVGRQRRCEGRAFARGGMIEGQLAGVEERPLQRHRRLLTPIPVVADDGMT